MTDHILSVIPAKAGISLPLHDMAWGIAGKISEIPAYAGMTAGGCK
jgi:hypothetical protein